MAVWRLQVNTGGANVADYCLQNHVAALWAGKVLAYLMGNYYDSKATYEKLFDWTDEHKFIKAILHVSDELIEKIYIDFFNRLPEFMQNALSEDFRVA